MHNVTSVQLTRDCDAVQIPSGTAVTLPAGTPVDITQTLGGTYTIHAQGGLYRITASNADALGLQPPEAPNHATPPSAPAMACGRKTRLGDVENLLRPGNPGEHRGPSGLFTTCISNHCPPATALVSPSR